MCPRFRAGRGVDAAWSRATTLTRATGYPPLPAAPSSGGLDVTRHRAGRRGSPSLRGQTTARRALTNRPGHAVRPVMMRGTPVLVATGQRRTDVAGGPSGRSCWPRACPCGCCERWRRLAASGRTGGTVQQRNAARQAARHRRALHRTTRSGGSRTAHNANDRAPSTNRPCMSYDVDAHYRRAREAGAQIDGEPIDQPYGQREYGARDSEGHRWWFAALVAPAGQ